MGEALVVVSVSDGGGVVPGVDSCLGVVSMRGGSGAGDAACSRRGEGLGLGLGVHPVRGRSVMVAMLVICGRVGGGGPCVLALDWVSGLARPEAVVGGAAAGG